MSLVSGAMARVGLAKPSRFAGVWHSLLAAERGRFVLWLPVFLGAGDALYFALRTEPPAWLGFAAFAAALAAWLLLFAHPLARVPFACCAAVAMGFASAQSAAIRAPPFSSLPSRAVVLTGTVRAVEALPNGRRISLAEPRIEAGPALARSVRIRLRNDDPVPVESGDLVRLRAMVRLPPPPAYPGAWDLQRDAFFSGVGGYGYGVGAMEKLGHSAGGGFWISIQRLREAIARHIAASLDGSVGAIATTLLTGLTAGIPPADRAAFRDSGLAHLLAIAGLHIGIVMGLLMGFTRLLLASCEYTALHWPTKSIAALIALAAGGGYMLLTGVHVPIVRSFAMATLATVALLAGRRAVSLRGLGLAAVALILLEPEQITGVSLQMSFSAVLALVSGYEWLRPHLARLRGAGYPGRRALLFLAGLALTSLLAGTASAPFAAYHFGQIQFYFILANIIAVPLTGMWIMPAGLIALALMPFGLEHSALVVMGWGVALVLWVARTVSALPAATLRVPHMPLWGLLLLALGMAWLGIWRSRLRLAGVPVLTLALISPLLVRPPDILLSADARLIALRTPSAMYVYAAPGAARFTLESWEQFWASGPARPISVGPREVPEHIACSSDACVLRARVAGPTALLITGEGPLPGCAAAAILLSSERARGRCPGPLLVDRFSAWRNGAYAIWLNPEGPRVLSDRLERGARPWVVEPADERAPLRQNLSSQLLNSGGEVLPTGLEL